MPDKVDDKKDQPIELELNANELFIIEAALAIIQPYRHDMWAILSASGIKSKVDSTAFTPVRDKIETLAKQLRSAEAASVVLASDDDYATRNC